MEEKFTTNDSENKSNVYHIDDGFKNWKDLNYFVNGSL